MVYDFPRTHPSPYTHTIKRKTLSARWTRPRQCITWQSAYSTIVLLNLIGQEPTRLLEQQLSSVMLAARSIRGTFKRFPYFSLSFFSKQMTPRFLHRCSSPCFLRHHHHMRTFCPFPWTALNLDYKLGVARWYYFSSHLHFFQRKL